VVLSTQTEFILSLLVLLGTALVAGEIVIRLGQPALVGQLITGVILGPYLLGPFYGVTTQTGVSPSLSAIQFLATFLILFMAGMEMGPEEIYGMKLGTLLTGISVFLVPFGSCFVVAYFLFPSSSLLVVLFIAVTVSITALPVMGIMISEFGLTGSRLGRLAMTVALINELTALTVFAILLQVYNGGGHPTVFSLAIALGSVALFLAVVLVANRILVLLHQRDAGKPREDGKSLSDRAAALVRYREAGFMILMVLALGAALLSQALGLTFVIGAFYAGILVTPSSVGERAYKTARSALNVVCWGFFIPLFFAITGLQVNVTVFLALASLGTVLALFTVAASAKIGAGSVAAKLQGWDSPNALAFGFMVNSRGAVEIAMAVILLGDGVLSSSLFTVVVAVGVATTILAPIGAMRSWRMTGKSREELAQRMPGLVGKGGAPPLAPPRIAEEP